jgi:hypothetical protein
MSVALTTKAKVKSYLGITSTSDDTFIDSLILDMSAQIETYCNREFEQGSFTEYFDVENGDTKIFLANFPIGTAITVSYRTGTWGDITYLSYNVNDFLPNYDSGKISFAGAFNDQEKYVKVDYTGGYLVDFNNETNITLHTLPRDLSSLATEMVARSYQLRKTAGVSSESTEGQSITYSGGSRDLTSNSDYSSRLMRYRNINI